MAAMRKIDINKVDQKTIETLPNITPILVRRILKYRQKYGNFESVMDLGKVRGITHEILNNLKDFIEINSHSKKNANDLAVKNTIYFYGEPLNMKGSVLIENKSQSLQKNFKLQFEKQDQLGHFWRSPNEIKIRKPLQAGEKAIMPVSFSLDQTTPPGIYNSEALLEGEKTEMVFDIAEKIEVSLSPEVIYFEIAPGTKLEKPIYVTNNGNVNLQFESPGALILEDEHLECRTIRSAVRSLREMEDINQVFKIAANELEKLYDEAGVLRVSLKGDPIVIEPAETKRIDLVFSFPSTLNRSSFYEGVLRFFNDRVLIKVIPSKTIIEK